jgi:hypothetical protein
MIPATLVIVDLYDRQIKAMSYQAITKGMPKSNTVPPAGLARAAEAKPERRGCKCT